jgi:cbb3-type cytochrome oxidase maturation protein
MEILYLLIPFSLVLILLIVGVFAWAVKSGQLDDFEGEAERILADERYPEPPQGSQMGQAGASLDARQSEVRQS